MYNMNCMHIDDFELGEIRLIAELAQLRKLSAAAARLGLSQSAASHALARLRRRAGDPLFIRSAAGFQPTPYGERLGAAARAALDILLDGFAANPPFDPAASGRRFNVYMSDVGQMVILREACSPTWDARRRRRAGAPVRSRATSRAPRAPPARSSSRSASSTTSRPGFARASCFASTMSAWCAPTIRASAPACRREAFAASSSRALADASGMAHAVIEAELKKHRGLAGTERLVVPQFMVLPLVIANSNLLVIMPQRLAKSFALLVPIKIMRPPVPLRPYDIRAYWHERFHRDPANRWLRGALVELFRAWMAETQAQSGGGGPGERRERGLACDIARR